VRPARRRPRVPRASLALWVPSAIKVGLFLVRSQFDNNQLRFVCTIFQRARGYLCAELARGRHGTQQRLIYGGSCHNWIHLNLQ
jgi:hypothetical protein